MSQSGNKRQRNACSNYATLERTVLRTQSLTNKQKKQTPHFRTYSRRALCDLPQTLHGDRARRAHQKGVIHFFDSTQRVAKVLQGAWKNLA